MKFDLPNPFSKKNEDGEQPLDTDESNIEVDEASVNVDGVNVDAEDQPEETTKRYCKSCHDELPSTQKGKYCKNCKAKIMERRKAVFGAVGAGIVSVGGAVLTVIGIAGKKK